MTKRLSFIDRGAQRLVDSDGADHGDERERAIVLEAQAFGMHLMALVSWLGALLLAVVGQVGAPIALILAPLIPALGSLWYSRRRGVDSYALMARASLSRTLGWTAFYAVVLFATIAALIHRLFFGDGLLPVSLSVEIVGEDLQRAAAISALSGAGIGVLVSMAWTSLIVCRRRRRAKRAEALELD